MLAPAQKPASAVRRRPGQPMSAAANVTLTVVGADRLPTAQDRALVVVAQALLLQDEHFKMPKTPTLSRCEVNAGLEETAAGYLCLRYDIFGAVPQEFWANWGKKDRVA